MRGGQIYPGERPRLLLFITVAAVLHGLAFWLWMLWSSSLEQPDAAPGVLKIGLVVAAASTSTAVPSSSPVASTSPVAPQSAAVNQVIPSVADAEQAQAISNATKADNSGSQGQADAGVDEALTAQRSWRAQVTARIAQQWRYPMLARVRALEGEVHIAFVLDRAGVLVETRVLQSSGYTLLDAAAVALVERAAPYPKPPVNIEEQALSLNVPIHYRLPK